MIGSIGAKDGFAPSPLSWSNVLELKMADPRKSVSPYESVSMTSTASESTAPTARPRRQLIWVPIVHTQEDMGQLRDPVKDQYVRRAGQAKWEAHVRTVEAFWAEIRRLIEDLGLDDPHVRLYQDGLPVCDHEERIVRELAEQGSVNHRLLIDLIDRGARLTGTESPQLLVQEYELNRRILGLDPSTRPNSLRAREIQAEARRLLAERDQFIADRIAETLQPAEQGLIFLGMLHSLEKRLPNDIQVTMLRPGGRQRIGGSRPV